MQVAFMIELKFYKDSPDHVFYGQVPFHVHVLWAHGYVEKKL